MKTTLNIDPNRSHHYIISVGMESLRSKNPGTIFLKHGPIYFTNDDIKDVEFAVNLINDQIFKTTNSEAIETINKKELVNAISSIKIAAMANDCTLHHFSSEYEFDEEFFEVFVDNANHSNYTKKLLKDSKIIGA